MPDNLTGATRHPLVRVALNNCRFYAYHGVLPHERVAGNEFEVSLEVSYTPGSVCNDSRPSASVSKEDSLFFTDDDISATISYADLFDIVSARMKQPVQLLETIASLIATDILSKWPNISRGMVTITKLSPPIPHFNGSASVSLDF